MQIYKRAAAALEGGKYTRLEAHLLCEGTVCAQLVLRSPSGHRVALVVHRRSYDLCRNVTRRPIGFAFWTLTQLRNARLPYAEVAGDVDFDLPPDVVRLQLERKLDAGLRAHAQP